MSKLKSKHVVSIVGHEFEDVEVLYPLLRLSDKGAKISIIPVKTGFHSRPYVADKPVTGRFGHTIKDGNILTGRVPDDLPEFCQNIINSLEDK